MFFYYLDLFTCIFYLDSFLPAITFITRNSQTCLTSSFSPEAGNQCDFNVSINYSYALCLALHFLLSPLSGAFPFSVRADHLDVFLTCSIKSA